MTSKSIIGRFRLEEVNQKQNLVYYLETAAKQSIDSSPRYICALLREVLYKERIEGNFSEEEWKEIFSDDNSKMQRYQAIIKQHYVLPLFWCKNKDDVNDKNSSCYICYQHLKTGTGYYLCVTCDHIYHKECIEVPPEIKHPYHPNHILKFCFNREDLSCVHCHTKEDTHTVSYCTICTVGIHIRCAFKSLPFVIEKTKRHHHSLTFFTRKDHLRCNVCGSMDQTHQTYVCLKCDFVVHQNCADFPSIIRISRHHHRIFFTSSLPARKLSCGVCRKNVDGDYGAYTCNKCDDYVVHSKCALRKDIWDEKELEEIPEEDDIEEVLDPFERVNDGSIIHFLHDHHLNSEISGEVYDESKICHVCVLPIYEGKFYSCMECDFILHDSCANAPRKIRHPLHPHPLTLKITSAYDAEGFFTCDACHRHSSGFVYECNEERYCFKLDVKCGSISEPFSYQGHEHPLFLALDPQEKYVCQVCQEDDGTLNCIECDFIICLKCVNLPYMVKYKHDKHFLTLVHGEETEEPNWCEICEEKLSSSRTQFENDIRFYECNQCCTTLHIKCLLGNKPYMKPGHTVNGSVQILPNNSLSRPLCVRCGNRCIDKIFFKHVFSGFNKIGCCIYHAK